MNALAEQVVDREVGSIFLYTHEAHPGEHYPHLTTMAQKRRHAQAVRDLLRVTRPILLDALDGACHRAYGGMPNMTWIVSQAGTVLYKSDWTDAHSVANAVAYFLQVVDRRKRSARLVPFRVERLDCRDADRAKFFEGLARNGPKAVTEFEAFSGAKRPSA